ncbi:MAG: zinc transporter ZntB [Aeromonadaceae bacterium]|nr:zinc transporter ZntB [Aeromonadaceae bacterium]
MTLRLPTASVFALRFDGQGGAEMLPAGGEMPDEDIWLHLDYSSPHAYEWIKTSPLLPEAVRESLQGESSRPKLVKANGGMLLTLRCINANEGQRPDHMVAVRFFISDRLVVSTRRRPVQAVEEIVEDLNRRIGPLNTADWLVDLCEHITEQAGDFIDELQERIAVLEEHLLSERHIHRSQLADIRRQLIVSRRYLAPQRDLFSRLANEKVGWLEADDLRRLQEITDRLSRWLDDLDASIARTSLLADELTARLTEAMTRRTYIMSLMAMVFLPATFLTGLFGVNLGGIPGGSSPVGFFTFVSLLLTLVVGLGLWLRYHKWL